MDKETEDQLAELRGHVSGLGKRVEELEAAPGTVEDDSSDLAGEVKGIKAFLQRQYGRHNFDVIDNEQAPLVSK